MTVTTPPNLTAPVVMLATLKLEPLCTLCGEPAALIEMPEPPALAIPEVLEYAAKAIVKFLTRKAPEVPVELMFEDAKAGRWRPMIAEVVGMARGGGMTVICQACLGKGWTDAR